MRYRIHLGAGSIMRPIHVYLAMSKVYPKSVYYKEASYIGRKTNECYTNLLKNND